MTVLKKRETQRDAGIGVNELTFRTDLQSSFRMLGLNESAAAMEQGSAS